MNPGAGEAPYAEVVGLDSGRQLERMAWFSQQSHPAHGVRIFLPGYVSRSVAPMVLIRNRRCGNAPFSAGLLAGLARVWWNHIWSRIGGEGVSVKVEVRLPQWGMGMTEGTIAQWLKQVGDQVNEGEALAQVETAKVETELESPETGVLVEIKVAAGTTVEIYTPLAVIDTGD